MLYGCRVVVRSRVGSSKLPTPSAAKNRGASIAGRDSIAVRTRCPRSLRTGINLYPKALPQFESSPAPLFPSHASVGSVTTPDKAYAGHPEFPARKIVALPGQVQRAWRTRYRRPAPAVYERRN